MVCFLCLLTNYRRNNPQCCWESIFLPICQSVNIDNCEVINTPPPSPGASFLCGDKMKSYFLRLQAGKSCVIFPCSEFLLLIMVLEELSVYESPHEGRSTRRCCLSFISWTMLHFLNSLFGTDFQKFTWMLQKAKAPIAVDDTSARSSRLLCFFPVSQSQRIKMTVSP